MLHQGEVGRAGQVPWCDDGGLGDVTDGADACNLISGNVTGSVVQAGAIGHLTLSPERHEPLPVPRQLPAGLRDFTDRDDHLAALNALLPSQEAAGGTAVVDGTGGGGKTTLAVQWAYRVQELFPDGTLFVNLRRYGPSVPCNRASCWPRS